LAFSCTTAFGLITAFGYITVGCCIALQLHCSFNCLAVADGLIDLINFNGISLGIISLVGSSTLVDCWIKVGIISLIDQISLID
jgi:hypothetical protein